jgi:hypothetical protein
MSEVWIEDSRQIVCDVCNHVEVMRTVYHQRYYALRPEAHESATDYARAAERCRPGTICRGCQLDAKRDTHLFETCCPSSGSIGECVAG